MIKNKKLLKKTIAMASILSLSAAGIFTSILFQRKTNEATADVTTYSYDSNSPFFENVYNPMPIDNTKSLDYWYDQLPHNTKTNNFCSLGTAVYDNINGNTVTVDCFNRNIGDSLDDPNFGQGILLYQTIQYKIKHPTEEMFIDFASYRTSVTASVCARRDSKFFGYNRALFDSEYDQFGFVRLSFMFIEAARMGIFVTLNPQLPSYGVSQYSSTASSKRAYHEEILYDEYFSTSLNVNCYSQYAAGKKVKDFLSYKKNEWDSSQRGVDEQHSKFLAVSAYTDYQDVDHHYGLYTSSANLDTVNYKAVNANGGSQTGSIVTGHKELCLCAHNFSRILNQYSKQDQVADFRYLIRNMNKTQIDLINENRFNEIPEDEMIVYKGTSNDNVFECYFSPMAGNILSWDTTYVPFCYYISEFGRASAPLVFSWTAPYFENGYQVDYTFEELIANAFHNDKNPNNRVYIHIQTFNVGLYNDLVEGVDIGFKYVNLNLDKYLHSKDIIMSYYLDGVHKYVSILTSCNFGTAPIWYRTNQTIVIKENDSNHVVYSTLGKATSYGCITG